MTFKMEQTDKELYFEYTLRLTKSRIRLIDLLAACFLMLAVLIAVLLSMVLCDHYIPGGIPASIRQVVRWGLLICELGLAGSLIVWPMLRRINDLYVARMIERANPRLRDELTAVLQLSEDKSVHPGALAAIRRRASTDAAGSDAKSAVNLTGLKLSAFVLAVAVAAFMGYVYFSPKPVMASLRRALGDDTIAPPTHTHIVSVQPGDGEYYELGEVVRFSAEISKPDSAVTLNIICDPSQVQPGGNVETLPMDKVSLEDEKNDGESFMAVWPAVGSKALFQIICGDAETQWRTINILPPPAIRKISTRCKWPGYTGRGVIEQPGGRIEAIAGVEVTVKAETNIAIRQASLEFEKNTKSLLMSIHQGRELSTAFKLKANDRYRVLFTGDIIQTDGESIWYDVRVVDDKPPTVMLTQPIGDEVELAVDETLHVAGEAMDDFGLAGVELVFVLGGASHRVSISQFNLPGPLANPIDKRIEVSSLGQPGDELLCSVLVRDFKPMGAGKPTGQAGSSRQFKLRILNAPTEPEIKNGGGEQAENRPESQAGSSQSERKSDKQKDDADRETTNPQDNLQDDKQEESSEEEPEDADQKQAIKDKAEAGQVEQDKDKQQPDGEGQKKEDGQDGQDNQGQQNGDDEKGGEEVFQKTLEVAREEAEKLETLRQRLDKELDRDKQQKQEQEQRNGQADPKQQSEKDNQAEKDQVDPKQQGGQGDKKGKGRAAPEQKKEIDKKKTEEQKKPKNNEKGKSGSEKSGVKGGEENPKKSQQGEGSQDEKKDTSSQTGKAVKNAAKAQKTHIDEQASRSKKDKQSKQGQGGQGGRKGKPDVEQNGKGRGQADPNQQGKQKDKAEKGQADSQQKNKSRGQGQSNEQDQSCKKDQGMQGKGDSPQGSGGKGKEGQGKGKGQQGQQAKQGSGDLGARDLHAAGGDRSESSETRAGTEADEKLASDFPKADVQKIESLGRAIDEANKQIRDNEIDPELLKELGMTDLEFRGFVEKNTERYEQLRKKVGQAGPKIEKPDVIKMIGSSEVRKGEASRAETGNVTGGPDGAGQKDSQIRQQRSRRVSPEYRKRFEAFLRSVSDQPATQPAGSD